jgi:hypothetical protein
MKTASHHDRKNALAQLMAEDQLGKFDEMDDGRGGADDESFEFQVLEELFWCRSDVRQLRERSSALVA